MPRQFVGRTLRARADQHTVRLYDGAVLVKTHARAAVGGRSTDASDFPPERTWYALRDVHALERQARSYGDAVGRFAAALLDDPLPWTRMRRVYALLGLVRRYGAARVDETCATALAAEMLDVQRLETHARARPAADRRRARPCPAARALPPPRHAVRVAAVTGRASFRRRRRMTADVISADLKTVLRRLKLGRMLDTLPERLVLARQQKLPHQDFLTLVLSDEATRRDSLAVALRVQRGHLDPALHLDAWDPTARVTFDRALLNELTTLRFLDAHAHVAIVGPVGVGRYCP